MKLLERINKAAKNKKGIRLSWQEVRLLENKVFVDDEEFEDMRQRALVASTYLTLRDCGLCGKVQYSGYVCCHCGGDDTAPREES